MTLFLVQTKWTFPSGLQIYFDKNYCLRGSDEFDAKFRVKVVDRGFVRVEIRNKKAQFTQ